MDTAIFAAGCFWGVQHYLGKQEGVVSSQTGYIGGHKSNPLYPEVKAHTTGHLEAVKVVYDPDIVSYEDLCKLFFEIHDPSQKDGQGPDIGPQYLSGIFYKNENQKNIAETVISVLRNLGYEVNTILAPYTDEVNENTPVSQIFWPAEDYHQHYYDKTGDSPYCHFRVRKFV